MINDWRDYIETKICKPIDMALNGIDPGVGVDANKLKVMGKVWYVKKKNNQGDLLFECLRPYLDEYLFEPWVRICARFDYDSEQIYWRCMATNTIKDIVREVPASRLLEGKNIIDIVGKWASDEENGYARIWDNTGLIMQAVIEGWKTDWEAIRERVKAELLCCPSDYDRIRLEYFCLLDAIIKIGTYDSITEEQRKDWYELLRCNWRVLAMIYSVMTGHIINSNHKHFSSLISMFKGSRKEYASLMVAALRHHPQVLENERMKQLAKEVEGQMRTIKQNRDLHELCACLFPSEHWKEYNLDAPRMTTAEMMKKISFLEEELENSNTRKQDQERLEKLAEHLKSQLGDSISMEDLERAILSCPPTYANLIFTQLDLRLEDVNEAWTRHRKDLKKKVIELESADSKKLDDTHSKVVALESKPNSVNYNYASGAVHEDYSRNLTIRNENTEDTKLLLDI